MIREFNFMIGQELHTKIETYRNKNNISYNKAIFIIFNMMILVFKKEMEEIGFRTYLLKIFVFYDNFFIFNDLVATLLYYFKKGGNNKYE